MKIITIAEIADDTGRSTPTVRRAVRKLGVGRKIGNAVVLTAAEAMAVKKTIRETKMGGPNVETLWKHRGKKKT